MAVTADEFVRRLEELPQPPPMGQIFALAKASIDMEPAEIERLLERPDHAARVGAVSASCSTSTSDATT